MTATVNIPTRHLAQSDLSRLDQEAARLVRPLLSAVILLPERPSALANAMASPGKEIESSWTVEVVDAVIAIRQIARPSRRRKNMSHARPGDRVLL